MISIELAGKKPYDLQGEFSIHDFVRQSFLRHYRFSNVNRKSINVAEITQKPMRTESLSQTFFWVTNSYADKQQTRPNVFYFTLLDNAWRRMNRCFGMSGGDGTTVLTFKTTIV